MSGFVKHDHGKPDFSLLPAAEIEEVVCVLTQGAKKYAADNWKKGTVERYIAAANRHIFARMKGEVIDADFGYSHAAHAICCLLFIMWLDKPENQGFVPLTFLNRNQIRGQMEKNDESRNNPQIIEAENAHDGAKMGRNLAEHFTDNDLDFFGAAVFAYAEAHTAGRHHDSEHVRIRAYELFENRNQQTKGENNA